MWRPLIPLPCLIRLTGRTEWEWGAAKNASYYPAQEYLVVWAGIPQGKLLVNIRSVFSTQHWHCKDWFTWIRSLWRPTQWKLLVIILQKCLGWYNKQLPASKNHVSAYRRGYLSMSLWLWKHALLVFFPQHNKNRQGYSLKHFTLGTTLSPSHLEALYYISPEYTPPAVGHVVFRNIKTGFSWLRLVRSVTLLPENLPPLLRFPQSRGSSGRKGYLGI